MATQASSGTFWRHKKRGTIYEVVAEGAAFQWSEAPDVEHALEDVDLVIYRDIRSTAHYVRPLHEFCDGRFERVETAEG